MKWIHVQSTKRQRKVVKQYNTWGH